MSGAMTTLELTPWIKNSECPYHGILKIRIPFTREGNFEGEVKIDDLVDIIETNGDESTRSIKFVAGFKQKRNYHHVMLVSSYQIQSNEDIQDKDTEQIEIPDIAFYRILERKSVTGFE